MTTERPTAYDPHRAAEVWSKAWAEAGLFEADPHAEGEPFSVVIPPPNVTGSLHMGHALNNTLQDVLVRYKRMDGFNTVWVPGTDHAGIATQWVVRRQLEAEGLDFWELGREKFVERVWAWKEVAGGTISKQLVAEGAVRQRAVGQDAVETLEQTAAGRHHRRRAYPRTLYLC